MQVFPFSRQYLRIMQRCSRQDIMKLPYEQMAEIAAAEYALGETELSERRCNDLLEKNGDRFGWGKNVEKILPLAISAAIGLILGNNVANIFTLSASFLVQGIAGSILGALICAGSEWVAATVITDSSMILYRVYETMRLRTALIEAKNNNEFITAFVEGQLDQLGAIENEFVKDIWMWIGSPLFVVEALAGGWTGWQASEDYMMAFIAGIAPVSVLLLVAGFFSHLFNIPDRKRSLLNNYRHELGKYQFREEGNSPNLLVLPSLPANSPEDGSDSRQSS